MVDMIEKTRKENGRDTRITSKFREGEKNHGVNGAVDFSSKDLEREERHDEAKELSKRGGPDHTVVVEEVHRPQPGAEGPSGQVDTAYRNGEQGKSRVKDIKASNTHTHIHHNNAPDPSSSKTGSAKAKADKPAQAAANSGSKKSEGKAKAKSHRERSGGLDRGGRDKNDVGRALDRMDHMDRMGRADA